MEKTAILSFTPNQMCIIETALDKFIDDLLDSEESVEESYLELINSALIKFQSEDLENVSNEELCVTYDAIQDFLSEISYCELHPEEFNPRDQENVTFISNKSSLVSAARKIKKFLLACGVQIVDN